MPRKQPDAATIALRLTQITQELAALVGEMVAAQQPEPTEPKFIPNAFQKGILDALKGRGLRTDALGAKVGSRSRLFADPGGLPELQELGLVAHHPRIGFYRLDAPPPEMSE